MKYFSHEKIEILVTKHNWEMIPSVGGAYKLRQKGRHYMETVDFMASDETVKKFCVTYNNR